jgi:hypothetical protein
MAEERKWTASMVNTNSAPEATLQNKSMATNARQVLACVRFVVGDEKNDLALKTAELGFAAPPEGWAGDLARRSPRLPAPPARGLRAAPDREQPPLRAAGAGGALRPAGNSRVGRALLRAPLVAPVSHVLLDVLLVLSERLREREHRRSSLARLGQAAGLLRPGRPPQVDAGGGYARPRNCRVSAGQLDGQRARPGGLGTDEAARRGAEASGTAPQRKDAAGRRHCPPLD